MDQKIKDFWVERSKLDKFLWQDLAELNAHITNQYLRPGMQVLDLGCGDGSSTRTLKCDPELTLVDYIRPAGLALPDGAVFIQEDIRSFRPSNKFDIITLYGVANSFDRVDTAKIYHMCYGWLKDGGVLLVKHQCGKTEDVFVDKFSDLLSSHYCAYYYSVDNHRRMLRRAGLDVETNDPYPADKNKWDNTTFKAFVCRKPAAHSYADHFPQSRIMDSAAWDEMQKRQKTSHRSRKTKWELLKAAKTHLDENDIPFYLMFGTLLGAVREKNFITWDGDVDIAILGRFEGRLAKLVETFQLPLLRVGEHYCSLALSDEFLDIYTYTEGEEKYSYCGGMKPFFDEDKDVFDSPSWIKFKDGEFMTVKDPHASLTRWYGGDWTTHKKDFWPK